MQKRGHFFTNVVHVGSKTQEFQDAITWVQFAVVAVCLIDSSSCIVLWFPSLDNDEHFYILIPCIWEKWMIRATLWMCHYKLLFIYQLIDSIIHSSIHSSLVNAGCMGKRPK